MNKCPLGLSLISKKYSVSWLWAMVLSRLLSVLPRLPKLKPRQCNASSGLDLNFFHGFPRGIAGIGSNYDNKKDSYVFPSLSLAMTGIVGYPWIRRIPTPLKMRMLSCLMPMITAMRNLSWKTNLYSISASWRWLLVTRRGLSGWFLIVCSYFIGIDP